MNTQGIILTPEQQTTINRLKALSPLDGRYGKDTEKLAKYFSEEALILRRLIYEVEYFILLATKGPEILHKEIDVVAIRNLYVGFNTMDALRIKEIEKITQHDVKAVEYWMREKFDELGYPADWKALIHYGLTSEDVDCFARGLSVRDGIALVVDETIDQMHSLISSLVEMERKTMMLGRTHGQPALPTTLGKEIKVFLTRLKKARGKIKGGKIPVKFGGAMGTRASLEFAHADFNWREFADELVKKIANYEERYVEDFHPLGLERIRTTAQIAPNDNYVEIFDAFIRFNTILIGFCRDMWQYISDDWVKQKIVKTEVGSSAMPQKVNPINFENAEGNLIMANGMFETFKVLMISRLQRDLTGSTIMRNFGSAFGYSLVAYKNVIKGLDKIEPNRELMWSKVHEHPEILTEAIQVILKRQGHDNGYELVKEFVRGNTISFGSLQKFIQTLDIDKKSMDELLDLRPETYLGTAVKKKVVS